MLISDEYKFLFIHIPKTGGSTVTWRLKNVINNPQNIDLDNFVKEKGWQGKFHYKGQHSSYLENRWRILRRRDYVIFAFVRNPYDLMFSWYTAINRDSDVLTDRQKFSDFVANPPIKYSKRINKTQSSYLVDRRSNLKVRNILFYEDFEYELQNIVELLNIPPERLSCENMNISNDNLYDYRDFYDKFTLDFVRDKYCVDFENFGYKPNI